MPCLYTLGTGQQRKILQGDHEDCLPVKMAAQTSGQFLHDPRACPSYAAMIRRQTLVTKINLACSSGPYLHRKKVCPSLAWMVIGWLDTRHVRRPGNVPTV
jgi:hypothetical protein